MYEMEEFEKNYSVKSSPFPKMEANNGGGGRKNEME
jgi:hypothetical protein